MPSFLLHFVCLGHETISGIYPITDALGIHSGIVSIRLPILSIYYTNKLSLR